MERLQSQLALAAFLQELGEAVEEAELVCFVLCSIHLKYNILSLVSSQEAMMTLLLAMVVTSGDGPPQSGALPGRQPTAGRQAMWGHLGLIL